MENLMEYFLSLQNRCVFDSSKHLEKVFSSPYFSFDSRENEFFEGIITCIFMSFEEFSSIFSIEGKNSFTFSF